ncbi:MAG: TraB/GumN family protein [Thermoplasmatota archaeon]
MRVDLPGITLVGTSHVSSGSVEEVRATIEEVRPAIVAVELDENRREALVDRSAYEATPIAEVVRRGRSSFVLAQSLLAAYQKRIAAAKGVEPGAEMVAAIQAAQSQGAKLVMADRDIGITLRRAYAQTGFREKMRISWELLKALIGIEEAEEIDADAMLNEDVLSTMMDDLAEAAPSVARVLVKERDAYLAAKIRDAAKGGTVVAVIGAGHLKGVETYLRDPGTIPDPAPLEKVERRGLPWGTIITVVIALAITALFAYYAYDAFRTGNFSQLNDALIDYVLATGVCTAVGALMAKGHPFAIITGFVAAPLKPFHFMLGSGVFPGLVQAHLHKPTLKDLHDVSGLQRVRDLYRNKATHVLLVTSLAQLGADIGLYIAFPLALHWGIPGLTHPVLG